MCPTNLRILTKRPHAIYSPAKRFEPWQLGRMEDLFRRHSRRLYRDQDRNSPAGRTVDLSNERQYITLFHWVEGADAEEMVRRGVLSEREASCLVRRVVHELAARGFRVLDTKLNHIILRTRRDQSLLRRDKELAYALIDFELLQRTAEHERWLRRDPDCMTSTAS